MYRPIATTVLAVSALMLFACSSSVQVVPTGTEEPTLAATEEPTPRPSETAEPTLTPEPTATATETPVPVLQDLAAGESLVKLAEFATFYNHYGVRMTFSPTEHILYHNGAPLKIQGYDFETGQVVVEIAGFTGYPPFILAVAPDASLIIAEDGNKLGIWELSSGEKLGELTMPSVYSASYAGYIGNETFWAADYSGYVQSWSMESWEVKSSFLNWSQFGGVYVPQDGESVVMHDGRRGEIALVDWSGNILAALPIQAQWSDPVSVSPQSDRAMVHADRDLHTEAVQILNLFDGTVERSIPTYDANTFAVSADWSLLAVAERRSILRFVDSESGEDIYTQEFPSSLIRFLAISPDGRYLGVYLVGESDLKGRIEIWSRATP